MSKTTMIRVNNGFTEDGERVWAIEERPVVTFKQIDDDLARTLMGFVHGRNLGKSITVGGKEYTLDHISYSKRRFGRGISVYFTVDRSVIRISDHWSESNGHARSRKLNCGQVADAYWTIENDADRPLLEWDYRAGRFPHRVLAGRAGKSVLNKSVDHWL